MQAHGVKWCTMCKFDCSFCCCVPLTLPSISSSDYKNFINLRAWFVFFWLKFDFRKTEFAFLTASLCNALHLPYAQSGLFPVGFIYQSPHSLLPFCAAVIFSG